MKKFTAFLNDESGATAIEYGLIAGIMSVMLIAAFPIITAALTNTFNSIAAAMAN